MPLRKLPRSVGAKQKRACVSANMRQLASENEGRKQPRSQAQMIAIALQSCGMARKHFEAWLDVGGDDMPWPVEQAREAFNLIRNDDANCRCPGRDRERETLTDGKSVLVTCLRCTTVKVYPPQLDHNEGGPTDEEKALDASILNMRPIARSLGIIPNDEE